MTKHLTPNGYYFLDIIAKYTTSTFARGEQILTHALNIMGDSGTHIFISDLKNLQRQKDGNPIYEFLPTQSDIILNKNVFGQQCDDSYLEYSLKQYLSMLYIAYPEKVEVVINGTNVNL